jgi:putative cell wall-binding protein
MLATGGTALAWGGGVITVTATPTTVFAGSTAQAGSDIALKLPNVAWNIGDTVTLTIANTNNGTTAANTIGISGTPTATAALPSNAAGASVKPTVSLALDSSTGPLTTAGVKDRITLTFTNNGDNSGDANGTPTVTLSGLKFNIGTNPTATTVTFNLAAAGTGTVPTFQNSVPAAITSVVDANISKFKVATTTVGAAPSATGVALSAISATDVTGGVITGKIQFSLGGGATFTTAGTLSTPSGVTASAPAETVPSSTLTYTLTGTTPANGVFTLTGAKATLGATVGDTVVTVATGAALGTPVGTANAAVTANVLRDYAGVNRYATAATIFADAVGNNIAVVASGTSFADALSANVAASSLGTGILLTDPASLPQDTALALKSNANDIQTVYIIGGPAAVSTNVQNQIAAIHEQNDPNQPLINVIRLAGADRYQTNNVVNLTLGAGATKAVVSTGANFADALAVAPEVNSTGYVLILTDPNTLVDAAKSTLTNLGITHVIIVGGTSAVSANVETQLGTAGATVDSRIAGADRTATAGLIAKWAVSGLPASGSYGALGAIGAFAGKDTVFLARGDNFADALAAGPLAGQSGMPVLLTATPSALGGGAATFLNGKGGTVKNIEVLGFAAAVNPSTATAAVAALG